MPYDIAVIGAGSFGAWTAMEFHRAGCSVLLIDAYGPANSRASSGGESRIIRMAYGSRAIYTQWSIESLRQWRALDETVGGGLFIPSGALWIAASESLHALDTMRVFNTAGVPFQSLDAAQLRQRYPHFRFADDEWAVLEPEAGGLMARRAIQALVQWLTSRGVTYQQRAITNPADVDAHRIVFACGPWLPKIFPAALANRILPSRQDVLFFGVPAGASLYGPASTPCWVDIASGFYGFADLESRGFKLALDSRGPLIDPDTVERTVSPATVELARAYLARRVPELASAPLTETRVCQYENTATTDYILDRHPAYDKVWIAGGGSGHGFKHGPSVGRYLRELILDNRKPESCFLLSTKPEFSELTQSSL